MANGGKITYDIGFNVDKGGLTELENTLKDFSKMSATEIKKNNPTLSMNEAMKAMVKLRQSVTEVQGAFGKAFDSKIGVLNIEKLQSSLKKMDLTTIQKNFSAIGPKGSEAFLKISQAALTTNVKLKETNSLMNKMGTTLINTLKWTFSSSLINRFTGAIQQAVGYVEHLDRSLNDIRIVTKKSADEMETFGQQANKAAQSLGKATTDYTEAALIYYQQGLSDEEVKARAETTLKAANVTGQATKTVSEQLTSVWNGFKVGAEQTEEYVDKLAAVAAMSASNLEELSTGMSKVASAAANLGVDIDQLTAQISTIVSVTRQAPESVGTALKTIYARISDLKLGENDEDGLGLGDVSGGLKKLGIEVLDSEGELRDLGTVIEEVAAKWDSWTSAQQAAVAQLMAGKRQYNNLVALFSNWDMYENAINTSRNATGELQKQQDIYMESTEAHIQQLKTQWEDLYDSVIDEDAIIGVTDALNALLKGITTIVDTIGGGSTLITGLISFVLTKFSPQITSQILMPFINNLKSAKTNAEALNQVIKNSKQALAENNGWGAESAKAMADTQIQMQKYWSVMTTEEKNESQELIRQIGYWTDLKAQVEKAGESVDSFLTKSSDNKIKDIGNKGSLNGLTDAEKKQAINYINEQQTSVKRLDSAYNELNKNIVKLGKNTPKTLAKLNDKGQVLGVDVSKVDGMKQTIQGMREELDKLSHDKVIDQAQFDSATKGLDKVEERIQTVVNAIEAAANDPNKKLNLKKLFTTEEEGALQNLHELLLKINPELAGYIDTITNGSAKEEDYTNKIKTNTDAMNENELKTRLRAQAITQFIGGLSQVSFVLQSVSGMMDTLADRSLSFGDKIGKVFLSLLTTAPAVVGMIRNLSSAAENLGGTFAKVFSAGWIGLAVGIATAIMGIVKAFQAANQAKLDKIADSANRAAEATQEAAKATQEYVDNLEKLNDKYQELNKELEEHSINLGDAKTQIYNLCQEYGLQQLAVEVLTTDYENLAESIRKAQNAAAEKNLEAASKNSDALFKKAVAEANQDLGEDVLDLTNLGSEQRQIEDFATGFAREVDTLTTNFLGVGWGVDWTTPQEKFIAELGQLGLYVNDSGEIATEDLIKAAATNSEALYAIINQYDIKASNELSEFLKDNQENIKAYREAVEKEFDATAATIVNPDDIKTVEDYEEAIQNLINNEKILMNFNGDTKAAEEWAKAWIGSFEQVSKVSQRANLEDQLIGTGNWTRDQLANYSDDELNFLFNNQALAKSKENLDDFFKFYEDEINATKDKQLAIQVSAVLASGEDGKKFSEDLVKNLFSSTEIEQITGVTQEVFEKLDFEGQKKLLKDWVKESTLAYKAEADNWEQNFEVKKAEVERIKAEVDKARQDAGLNENGSFTTTKAGEEQYQNNLARYGSVEGMIEALGEDSDMAKYAKFRQALKDIGVSAGDVEEQLKEINELEAQWSNQDFLKEVSSSYAQAATSIDELEQGFEEGIITVEDFTAKYKELDEAQDLEGLDTEELSNYSAYLQETADNAEELADTLEKDSDAAKVVAKSIMKMNKGIEELSSNYEEWNDILQNSEKSSEEYYHALTGMRSAMAKLLDISEEYVSSDFITEHLEDIGKAAEGDAEAIDRLKDSLREDVIMHFGLEDNVANDLLGKVEYWQGILDSNAIYAGATLDDTQMMNALSEMVAQAGLTVDQVNALFDSMGFETEFATEPQMVHQLVPEYVTETRDDGTTQTMVGDQPVTWLRTRTRTYQDGFYKATGLMDAMAMATNGKTPKINKITKKASGAMNNASGRNAGGKKSSGGGGGGGGGGKSAQKRDPMKRETDIYRKVNEELSVIDKQLDKIQTEGDHTWGAGQIPILEKEIDLLNQQTEKLKEKNKIQKGDLSNRRKQLEMEGVEFTEDGSVMKNAEAVIDKLYADYNKKLESMSAEEQEAHKDELDAEQERIKEVEKKISEYESLYSDYEDVRKQIQDNYYKKIEEDVKKFTHNVDIKLELNDAQKEWDEFWYDIIKDVDEEDFGGRIAKSFANLDTLIGANGNKNNDASLLLKQLTGLNSNVNNLFGEDTELAKEKLTEYRDKLMQTLRDTKSALDEMSETYLDALNHEQEIIDKQLEGWENIDKQLSHNIDLIKLMNPENNFDALEKQYQQQYENNLQSVDANKKAQKHWKERVDYYKRAMSTVKKGTVEWKTLNESYKIATENYITATENLNSAVEKALEDLKEQTENAVQKAYDMLDRAMSGGLGLEVIEDEWKLINDEAGKYYDNVERYLNMEEYTNTLEEAANAVGLSAENQRKLNEFRDQELKQLNEKEKLTAYDIEESKARLEIMKAQMALEDAQRNKTNMRLRRDSQGNYNYQYVANEGDVNSGENGVLTAKKEWYALVKKRYQETTQEILNMEKEQSNLLSKIRDAQLAGDEAREQKYKEMYDKNAQYIRQMYAETEKNKRDLYDGTAIYFANVENRTLEQSKTTVRNLVDLWGKDGEESFTKAASDGIKAIDKAQEDWLNKSNKILTTAGVNYKKLKENGIDPTKKSLESFTESNKKMNEKLKETSKILDKEILPKLQKTEKAFTSIKQNAEKQIKTTNEIIASLGTKADNAKKKISDIITAAEKANKIKVEPKVSSGGSTGGGGGGGSSGGGGGGYTGSRSPSTSSPSYKLTAYTDTGYVASGYPITYTNKDDLKRAAYKIMDDYSFVMSDGSKNVTVNIKEYYATKENRIRAFKTGGYTGEWGNSGKLAVLHEKELVLNASDTKNILSAVELLHALPFSTLAKSIIDSSSNIAASFRSGINMSGINSGTTNNETKSMIVNADFSGVRSADEIYQALLELENYGLQNSYSVAPHANSSY